MPAKPLRTRSLPRTLKQIEFELEQIDKRDMQLFDLYSRAAARYSGHTLRMVITAIASKQGMDVSELIEILESVNDTWTEYVGLQKDKKPCKKCRDKKA